MPASSVWNEEDAEYRRFMKAFNEGVEDIRAGRTLSTEEVFGPIERRLKAMIAREQAVKVEEVE